MQMPEMDGEMLARKIRENPEMSSLVLVMLSSIDRRAEIGHLRAIGVDDVLVKPVKSSQLYDALIRAGRKKTVTGPLASQPDSRPAAPAEGTPRARILLAEDNAINQKVALRMLEKMGYRVDVVANGLEAVRAWQAMPYHLILMDVQMPEMDGFEATRMVREFEKSTGGHIAIVAMTAHAMKGDRERCIEAGMDDYIAKPVQFKELAEALQRALTQPSSADIAS
jgi:CheY-like chemotaxis protein